MRKNEVYKLRQTRAMDEKIKREKAKKESSLGEKAKRTLGLAKE
jgi:hypothetical protein